MNENKIIGVAELLKYNISIAEHSQYHKQLINIIVLTDNLFHRNIGVINICLELLTVLFKSEIRNAILGHILNELLENICSKFLYDKTDGKLRTDIQISVQSNVLNFVTACSNISISVVSRNTFLVRTAINMCKHTDFLIRENAIIFISELINNDVYNERNMEFFTILALVNIECFT